MARTNKTQYALLSLMSKYGCLSGYDLKQKANTDFMHAWSETNAQIYPTLKALESRALVSSRIDLGSGKREKRLYSITSEGLAHLEAWLNKPVEYSREREELLLKLHMASRTCPSVMKQHLNDYIQHLEQQLADLLSSQQHSANADPLSTMTHNHSQALLNAKLTWAKESTALFNK